MRATARHIGWQTVALISVSVALTYAEDLRLVNAAKEQDKPAVVRLLRERVNVNAAQPDGTTALHWAAHLNHVEIAEVLIRNGADVNATNALGITALTLACVNGSAPLAEKLLEAGANPNASDSSGETALMTAARAGNAAVVNALLDHGAHVNAREPSRGQTALMWAGAQRHTEVIRALIEHGADVHARSAVRRVLVNRGDPQANVGGCCPSVAEIEQGGSTPLLFSARHGHIESARLLLAAGARVNEAAADGSTALVIATHSGHRIFTSFLLENGADPNADGAGYSPLHAAVLRGDPSLVKVLLAHGANPDARVVHGTVVTRYSQDFMLPDAFIGATPLWLAAKFLEVDIMKMLAASGGDVAIPINDGTTPVMAAVGIGQINQGADRRERSVPAQRRARDQEEPRILAAVSLAVELGGDVNAANLNGDTVLHGAAAGRLLNVIRFLADHGSRLDLRNKRGLTPFGVASAERRGEPAVDRRAADLLRQLGSPQ